MRLVVLERHTVPTFYMEMVVMSGGLSDPPTQRGLASFTASMLREGTTKRTSKEIAEQVDVLGASLSAGSGLSSFQTNVSASGLVENFDPTLEIFSDVIRNPVFPKDEWEKFKARTLAQWQLQRSQPMFLAQERFQRAAYGDHPAAFIMPPADSLKKVTRDDLLGFHKRHFQPGNAMLAIVGDVTLKDIQGKIEQAFGNWASLIGAGVPKTVIPPAPVPGAAKIFLIDRPASVQTVLQLGNLGITRTDPDYFPLLVMNRILGGGPAARLFLNLREDKGYTYGVGSFFSGSKFRGTWTAFSSVRTEVTDGAMHEFMVEFKRIRDVQVMPEELENAKRALIGSFAMVLERPEGLLQNVLTLKQYELPYDYWDTYPQSVEGVTAADVQRVAKKYVDLAHLQIVAVGDVSKIRSVMAKYGAVELYDADGNRIDAAGAKGQSE
ncbi:MAG: insulinase family protein [Acidobacteria bacterium]|nr:insulinase family protein [Acidobacteriota bacterium]MBI3658652.1 insulinase family protein [Acidobacteriota bacterium]